MQQLKSIIESSFENIKSLKINDNLINTVNEIIKLMEQGKLRVAYKENGSWNINQWLKQAILLYFKINNNKVLDANFTKFFDKVPLQFNNFNEQQFLDKKVRVVPSALVRSGAYVGANSVLMPSYVNIGAYIDSGCMIDTWATVGSCAQIGKNVHISGGAGIGGVLEPLQATPTIIEDNCFIGARSEVVEGVIVEEDSVISMGVFLGQSTKIYDREKDEVTYGRIPKGSVVVPGTLPAKNGKYNLACAVIVKKIDQKTREKVSINEILRDI